MLEVKHKRVLSSTDACILKLGLNIASIIIAIRRCLVAHGSGQNEFIRLDESILLSITISLENNAVVLRVRLKRLDKRLTLADKQVSLANGVQQLNFLNFIGNLNCDRFHLLFFLNQFQIVILVCLLQKVDSASRPQFVMLARPTRA
jgi:hypothetical protein